jgi:ankyrin repeat protein
MTPLMWAAQFGKLEITEMLIQFGANISLKDIEEKNALNYANLYSPQNYSGAINVRHQEVIELLRKIEKTEN